MLFAALFSNILFAAETTIEVIPLYNRPASEIQPLLTPLLENTDRVIANGSHLVVKTTPERLAEIKSLINDLDTRLNNLIITVMQSRHTTAHELNAAAGIRLNIPIDDPSKSGGKITSRFSRTQDQNANESIQTIRTVEGNTAYIKAGNKYPITTTQTYYSGYGYPDVSTNTEFIDATTGFAVTPRLAGEQAVLDISPWSDRINTRNQIQTQNAQSTLRINLGEWIELGGIDENSQSSGNKNFSRMRQTGESTLRILIKVDKTD
ncbi:MAG: secretin N-terminal domain-containing protein [Methylobacter sp.]